MGAKRYRVLPTTRHCVNRLERARAARPHQEVVGSDRGLLRALGPEHRHAPEQRSVVRGVGQHERCHEPESQVGLESEALVRHDHVQDSLEVTAVNLRRGNVCREGEGG